MNQINFLKNQYGEFDIYLSCQRNSNPKKTNHPKENGANKYPPLEKFKILVYYILLSLPQPLFFILLNLDLPFPSNMSAIGVSERLLVSSNRFDLNWSFTC